MTALDQTAFTPPVIETVASHLAAGRSKAATETNLSQAHCVDVLLDCMNAAVRVTVKEVVADVLTRIAHVNLVTAEEFRDMLDLVQMALAVDAAFDHLDLTD